MDKLFTKYPGIKGIIHFAASKAVGEMLDFMFFVERLYGAVDPSEAKGFLDSVVVCNTFFARRFGGEYKPNVIGVFKVVCQPFSPIFSVFKIFYFHSAKKNSNPLLRIGCC